MIDTPRGWLTVFADQRYRAQPGAARYRSLVRNPIHHIADEAFERLVLHKLLVELREVLHRPLCRLTECLIVG